MPGRVCQPSRWRMAAHHFMFWPPFYNWAQTSQSPQSNWPTLTLTFLWYSLCCVCVRVCSCNCGAVLNDGKSQNEDSRDYVTTFLQTFALLPVTLPGQGFIKIFFSFLLSKLWEFWQFFNLGKKKRKNKPHKRWSLYLWMNFSFRGDAEEMILPRGDVQCSCVSVHLSCCQLLLKISSIAVIGLVRFDFCFQYF